MFMPMLKRLAVALAFTYLFFCVCLCISLWMTVAPILISFVEAPVHELSHVAAIEAIEMITGKQADILEVVFFNADTDSITRFCSSLGEMAFGKRYIGYVAWKDLDRFDWNERFWIGFAGGIGGAVFILFLWWGLWKIQKMMFRVNLFIALALFHIPFCAAFVNAILYAFEEAGCLGAPVIL